MNQDSIQCYVGQCLQHLLWTGKCFRNQKRKQIYPA